MKRPAFDRFGPELRVGADYFAIDYYPQEASSILFLPIRKVESYPADAQAVRLDIGADNFVRDFVESFKSWSEAWRELRK